MTERYDLLVIGGGSGGLAHAQRAAEYGAKAAVVEKGALGGTCVNVGCVPKKVMWYAAQHAHQLHHLADYGFDADAKGHDWAGLKTRRDAYIERLNGIYENNLDKRGVTWLSGTARFVDAHTVDIDGKQVQADRIVIATGGRPTVMWTSDAFSSTMRSKSICIVSFSVTPRPPAPFPSRAGPRRST